MRIIYLLTVMIGYSYFVNAQDLYLPRNIEKAYQKQTRSMDGKPGKNYWQNHGFYNITLNVNPPDKNIAGNESITYINNSPDTVRTLVFKMIMNIHKPGALRYFDVGPDYLSD